MTLFMELKRSRAEGVEEGMEKGMEKGRKEMILNMLESGMSEEDISRVAKLPLEQVKRIASESLASTE